MTTPSTPPAPPAPPVSTSPPVLAADGVTLAYGPVPVVHGVSLAVDGGGTGLIGESGSGKTTLARALLGLLRPRSGRVLYGGADLAGLPRRRRAEFRAAVQPVFQDGSEALDPRMSIGASIAEGLTAHHRLAASARRARVAELMADVGLEPGLATRRPHRLSGGQRQRAVIARALAVRPRVLVLDEPTSALDVTVQARILDLLEGLRAGHGLGYLLITHNLAVVDRLCRTSHVMFAGRVVESGPTGDLLARPAHPYTLALRDAVPRIGGPPPAAGGRTEIAPAGSGCPFRLRCPLADDTCRELAPDPRPLLGRTVACHRAEEVLDGAVRR
ncbi:peptide/nickel transport system ATP-binding protein [Sinosporangium album]|uniref:Peptide/nickel transport system ATP-binding protein n=1 Tax=Sinosporangium album TaxID=504805 RepID=A0A1G8I5J7_9ACTN|nr:ABC transporter ATP-binding protein [Sinosporangium album]SDI13870.1 peptide/nickel transport system ATP-binding protein [Sinosporangium album]